jgi:hypothetical protein
MKAELRREKKREIFNITIWKFSIAKDIWREIISEKKLDFQ